MRLNNVYTDEDAVSPVIGVILMVAITVILAAVIAGFVVGIGTSESPPQAKFEFSQSSETFRHDTATSQPAAYADIVVLEISHKSGDKIKERKLQAKVDGTTGTAFGIEREGSGSPDTLEIPFQDGTFSAGDREKIAFIDSPSGYETGDKVCYLNGDVWRIFDPSGGACGTGTNVDPTYVGAGVEFRLIWVPDSGDETHTVATYEVEGES